MTELRARKAERMQKQPNDRPSQAAENTKSDSGTETAPVATKSASNGVDAGTASRR